MNGLGVELVGYLASALVAVSMVMVSIVRLRVINMLGAVAFLVYGLFLPSIPIMLTNGFILAVNIVHLRRAWVQGRLDCEYVLVDPPRLLQLEDYLRSHEPEIRRFAPHFNQKWLRLVLDNAGQAYMAFHQSQIRGVALWLPLSGLRPQDYPDYPGLRDLLDQLAAQGKLHGGALLVVDHIDAHYRDLGLGKKLQRTLDAQSTEAMRYLYALCPMSSRRTKGYLRSQGFLPEGMANGLVLWQRPLPPPLPKEC